MRYYEDVKRTIEEIEFLKSCKNCVQECSGEEAVSLLVDKNFDSFSPFMGDNTNVLIMQAYQRFANEVANLIEMEVGERMKRMDVVEVPSIDNGA